MGTEIEEGEEGGERTGGKKSGGAGLGIAESKAQRRKPEASVWVLLDWWDPFIPHFLPVCFLLSVCSSCFDLPHSPSSHLNILQELPWDGKNAEKMKFQFEEVKSFTLFFLTLIFVFVLFFKIFLLSCAWPEGFKFKFLIFVVYFTTYKNIFHRDKNLNTKKNTIRDFLGGQVVKTEFPMQGVPVGSKLAPHGICLPCIGRAEFFFTPRP